MVETFSLADKNLVFYKGVDPGVCEAPRQDEAKPVPIDPMVIGIDNGIHEAISIAESPSNGPKKGGIEERQIVRFPMVRDHGIPLELLSIAGAKIKPRDRQVSDLSLNIGKK